MSLEEFGVMTGPQGGPDLGPLADILGGAFFAPSRGLVGAVKDLGTGDLGGAGWNLGAAALAALPAFRGAKNLGLLRRLGLTGMAGSAGLGAAQLLRESGIGPKSFDLSRGGGLENMALDPMLWFGLMAGGGQLAARQGAGKAARAVEEGVARALGGDALGGAEREGLSGLESILAGMGERSAPAVAGMGGPVPMAPKGVPSSKIGGYDLGFSGSGPAADAVASAPAAARAAIPPPVTPETVAAGAIVPPLEGKLPSEFSFVHEAPPGDASALQLLLGTPLPEKPFPAGTFRGFNDLSRTRFRKGVEPAMAGLSVPAIMAEAPELGATLTEGSYPGALDAAYKSQASSAGRMGRAAQLGPPAAPAASGPRDPAQVLRDMEVLARMAGNPLPPAVPSEEMSALQARLAELEVRAAQQSDMIGKLISGEAVPQGEALVVGRGSVPNLGPAPRAVVTPDQVKLVPAQAQAEAAQARMEKLLREAADLKLLPSMAKTGWVADPGKMDELGRLVGQARRAIERSNLMGGKSDLSAIKSQIKALGGKPSVGVVEGPALAGDQRAEDLARLYLQDHAVSPGDPLPASESVRGFWDGGAKRAVEGASFKEFLELVRYLHVNR